MIHPDSEIENEIEFKNAIFPLLSVSFDLKRYFHHYQTERLVQCINFTFIKLQLEHVNLLNSKWKKEYFEEQSYRIDNSICRFIWNFINIDLFFFFQRNERQEKNNTENDSTIESFEIAQINVIFNIFSFVAVVLFSFLTFTFDQNMLKRNFVLDEPHQNQIKRN